MLKFRRGIFLTWIVLVCFAGLLQPQVWGDVTISEVVSPVADGIHYNIFIFASDVLNPDNPDGVVLSGTLLSVTNAGTGESLPFSLLYSVPSVREIDQIPATFAPDVFLPQTFTLTWSNFSTNVTIELNPVFMVEPQSQSVRAGGNVIFTAQAYHASGYQWQENGTNLVENSHFAGVTNATLTIANAQPEDTGDYAVIAENPDSPLASAAAVLSVFKPIQLSLTPSLVDGSHQLVVTHQDGSPLDTNDVSHLVIFTTTNLSFSLSSWEVATNTGIVSNGIYQVDFPADGNAVRFWQVGQQP